MEHFGNFIRTGLLGALDWFGEQKPETQHFSIGMGGPSPTVSYHSGNRYEISNESFQSPQALPGTFAPAMPNAVWNPGAGMAGPATAPAIWDSAQQEAYPILPVAAQEEGEIPYYLAKRRPLDFKVGSFDIGKWIYNDKDFGGVGGDHNLRIEHQHLFRSDGTNIGFSDKGLIRNEGNLGPKYELDIPGLGNIRMKAKYMDPALEELNKELLEKQKALDEINARIHLGYGMTEKSLYNGLLFNCQDYVDEARRRAEKLAKENNDSLYF